MARWYRVYDIADETTIFILRDEDRTYAELLDKPTPKQSRETARTWGIDIAEGITELTTFMGEEV